MGLRASSLAPSLCYPMENLVSVEEMGFYRLPCLATWMVNDLQPQAQRSMRACSLEFEVYHAMENPVSIEKTGFYCLPYLATWVVNGLLACSLEPAVYHLTENLVSVWEIGFYCSATWIGLRPQAQRSMRACSMANLVSVEEMGFYRLPCSGNWPGNQVYSHLSQRLQLYTLGICSPAQDWHEIGLWPCSFVLSARLCAATAFLFVTLSLGGASRSQTRRHAPRNLAASRLGGGQA